MLKSLIINIDFESWKLLHSLQYRLLGQTTKEPLSNFEPKNLENISNFQGWGLTLAAYKKESVVRHMVLDSRNITRLTVPQPASSLTDSSSTDISPIRQLPNRTFLWSGSSPILHFTERTVLQITISSIMNVTIFPNEHFPNHMFLQTLNDKIDLPFRSISYCISVYYKRT